METGTTYHHAHYLIPRDEQFEGEFHAMLERCGFDSYGHLDEERFDAETLKRLKELQTKFEDDDPMRHYEIDTPVFTIRPFYWGDEREVYVLPNFVYKPWGIEMTWYKWPMRDAWCTADLSAEDWKLMCDTVERSLKQFERSGTWPDDIDDFPRMSEADVAALEVHKVLDKVCSQREKLSDVIFELLVADESHMDEARKNAAKAIGWDLDELEHMDEDDAPVE